MSQEECRTNGASENAIGTADRLPSPHVRRTISAIALASIAGLSLLLALRKPAESPHAAETKHSNIQNAREPFLVTLENGERVPVRFVEDGFTIQIERRFFQLKMITVLYIPITVGDIRAQLGKEEISSMHYQEGEQFVCQAGNNTFRMPADDIQKVISALHASPENDTEHAIPAIAFQLNLDDQNHWKQIVPSTGTMDATFSRKHRGTKRVTPLTAQSK